jgi:hypothetical protein
MSKAEMVNLRMSDGSFSATTGRLEMFVTYMAQCLRKTATTLVKARTTALVCRNSKRLRRAMMRKISTTKKIK